LEEAVLVRRELTDAQWALIENLVPGKDGDRGVTALDTRRFVDAVLWQARTGAPWRDLPSEFGNWNSNFVRFRRWTNAGVWQRLFRAMIRDPDFDYRIIDSTIVRAHQHSAGAKKGGLKIRRSAARAAD
jgi:putative transposase